MGNSEEQDLLLAGPEGDAAPPRPHSEGLEVCGAEKRGGKRGREEERTRTRGSAIVGWSWAPRFSWVDYRTIYNTKARGGAGGKSEGLTGRVLAAQGLRGGDVLHGPRSALWLLSS